MMKIILRILFFTMIFLPGYVCLAQEVKPQAENREEKEVVSNDQAVDRSVSAIKDNSANRDKTVGNKEGNVKQVKSARPDLTRTRGARPPNIVRPSGTRIPKGVGRPAGAGRPGH
jgi:hypothetical protein